MSEKIPRILVVEDDQAIQQVLTTLFAEKGFEVMSAPDAPRGVSMTLEQRPDVIILDLGLPGGSGLSVLETIRRMGVSAPILVLTGDASEATVREAATRGASDYMCKPADMPRLLERVLRLAGRAAA